MDDSQKLPSLNNSKFLKTRALKNCKSLAAFYSADQKVSNDKNL